PLGRGDNHQGMQLPDARIGVLPADPAQHRAVSVAGDAADLAWFKRLIYLGVSGCEVGPGIGRLVTKPVNECMRGLLDSGCIMGLKIRDMHVTVPLLGVPASVVGQLS